MADFSMDRYKLLLRLPDSLIEDVATRAGMLDNLDDSALPPKTVDEVARDLFPPPHFEYGKEALFMRLRRAMAVECDCANCAKYVHELYGWAHRLDPSLGREPTAFDEFDDVMDAYRYLVNRNGRV